MTITQLMENSLRTTAEILRALADKEKQSWVDSGFMAGDNGHKLKRHAENILISLGVMPKRIKVYQALARTFAAWEHCQNHESSNRFATQHEQTIIGLIRETSPSGSGIDSGVSFDFDESKNDRLVIRFDYHHMNGDGFYCGWTNQTLTIKPSLQSGFELCCTINGKPDDEGYSEDSALDYFYAIFDEWLNGEINPKDFGL
jgi:hypothetical protein